MVLTKADVVIIEDIVERKLEEKLEEKFDEKLKFLPTKDEFYTKMDEVMGELKAIREEQVIGSHQLGNHEDRLERLEKIHPQGQHAAAD
jgi:predicted nuclease with TOPRIM domain